MLTKTQKTLRYIRFNDAEQKTIRFINNFSNKKILKNPNYRTFEEYLRENNLLEKVLENESIGAIERDKYETFFGDFRSNGPGIYEKKYFSSTMRVIEYFFKKNPNFINEFLPRPSKIGEVD